MPDVQTTLRLNDQASDKLQKVANVARQAAQQMQQTGSAIDKAFGSNAPSTFASTAGNAMRTVTSEAESLGNAVDNIFEGADASSFASDMESGFKSAAAGAEEFSNAADGAGDALDEAASSAEELGENVAEAGQSGGGLDEVGEDAKDAGNEMDNASGKALNLGNALKSLLAVVGAVKIAKGIKDFVDESIALGTDYTHMMSEVAAISGATGQEYTMLEETARKYGASTVFTASEAAEALKYMSLAGWDAQQSAAGLPGVLNLAAASGMELGQASDMVTDYLTAFGMKASEATYMADLLSYAQANSNTTAEQLGQAYLNSAASMHAAGQDIETTTAMLEAMANQGTKGSRAGTQMAAIMRDITQKMTTYSDATELAKMSQEGFTSVTGNMNDILGTSAIQIGNMLVPVSDAKGNFRDLTDIMTDVETSLNGLGTAEASAALMETFTDRSVRGVRQILTEGMDAVSMYEEQLRASTGAAQKAADTMNDNLAGDKAMMKSAFEEMQLQVFEGMEGTLRDGTQWITGTIIPALTEWVPAVAGKIADGIGKIGKVLSPMIETILKNPAAVGTAFASIGTGLAAFGAVNKVGGLVSALRAGEKLSSQGGIIGTIGKLGSALVAHPWAALAAGVTAAVVAIGLAVKRYNDMQIKNNLAEHFGTVELTEDQMNAFADRVLNVKWLVNVEASLEHFEKADELMEQARQALHNNDAIEWKARIGLELNDDDVSSYTANIQSFIDSSFEALQEQTLAVDLALSFTELTMEDGSSFNDKIKEWALADSMEMQGLSDQLTQVVQNALMDGIIDVDEQAAIDLLQSKINNIMSGWKASEAKAQMDMLEQEYGRLSGKDLTADTFTELVEKLSEQRQTATEALEESNIAALQAVEAMRQRGRITDSDYEGIRTQIAEANRNERAGMLVNSLNFEANTLSDTYGTKLEQNFSKMKENTASELSAMNTYLKNEDWGSLWNSAESAWARSMEGTGFFSDSEQKALSNLWKTMKPDATAMQELVDEYRNAGQAVPKSIMDGFNDAMQIGAAAGDVDASWAVFARQLVEDPASQALEKAILDGTANVPQELKDAVERAALETTDDPVTFDSIQAELQGIEVDEQRVQELLANTIQGLSATGTTEIEGGELAVNYEVTTAMTASELADKLRMDVNDLLAVNPQITADTVLEVGTQIELSTEGVTIDTGEVGVAVEEARAQVQSVADGAMSDPITAETTADVTVTAGEVDDSALQTATEIAEPAPVDVTVTANETVTPGTVDTSQVAPAVTEDLNSQFSTAFEVPGTANVTITKASDNIPAVYSQVGTELQNAFNAPYSASATVNVTITANYSLANPTKTITFGGGGTGSATITASLHAMGGYFDQAHMGIVAEDGPEYIIPMDGSDRSREMWAEAGSMLGFDEQPIRSMPDGDNSGARGSTEATQSTKDINLNINGSGSMSVQSNMSKEDIVDVMIENLKDVLMNIVEQEILTEGDGAYEY